MKIFWLLVCNLILLVGITFLSQSIKNPEKNLDQKFTEKFQQIDPKLIEEKIKQLRKTMAENRNKIRIETLSLRKINNLLFEHCFYFNGRDQLPMKLQIVCKKLEERRDRITVKENHEELNKYE